MTYSPARWCSAAAEGLKPEIAKLSLLPLLVCPRTYYKQNSRIVLFFSQKVHLLSYNYGVSKDNLRL